MGARAARIAEQDARREQLARLRCERPLNPKERAEEARLERCLHMRVWREQQREVEARLARTLEQEDA
ncbi:MAG: hypothetical protein CL949_12605 [Erythrobacter sp.]|nr:hypothetical protein [Erythrobacter sp.]|tara:strand:- start:529 stop:732 length:204 start_codon:yes stop_codon:yes gene_type:complete